MAGRRKTDLKLISELETMERRFKRELTPEERKLLQLAGSADDSGREGEQLLGKVTEVMFTGSQSGFRFSSPMRRLEAVYNGSAHPTCWKCSFCQREFLRPSDVLDQTAHQPPVATWLEFESHHCQK